MGYTGVFGGIGDAIRENGPARKSDAEHLVEPKSDGDGNGGQEDEVSWRERLAAKQDVSGGSIDDGKELDLIPEDQHAGHSRLLTKKQLSDMAWGVRELSKRLGSVRLKLKVRNVFLLTKAHDESLICNTREVTKWLLSPEREVRYTVYVEDNLKENRNFNAKGLLADLEKLYQGQQEQHDGAKKTDRRLRFWNNEMCRTRPHTFDFVVTLGGDGTVLYASWLFQRIVPPVLSFALGSLGFLTKFDYEEFPETLTKAFRDGVTISLRLRFEGTVMRSQTQMRQAAETEDGQESEIQESARNRDLIEELIGDEKDDEMTHKPDGTYEILNDIVVDRGPNPSKIRQHISLLLLTFQLCHRQKSLEMMNTLLLFRQTESACPRPQVRRPITSLLVVLSATLRIPSF